MTIAIVGEFWNNDEEEAKASFVGYVGRMLNGLLSRVGIDPKDCLLTSVVKERPRPYQSIASLCGPRTAGIKGLPMVERNRYLLPKYEHHLARLYEEIEDFNPNIIITMDGLAMWAFTHQSSIRASRGYIAESIHGRKVLPTFHPSTIRKQFNLRPIVLADLMKAKRESEFPEIRRPEREIWIRPSLEDLAQFKARHIDSCEYISIDIETKGNQITCVGFSPHPSVALVVPFYDPDTGGSYWQTLEDELAAWEFVRTVCRMDKKMLFQNGLYDMSFFWQSVGIAVPHAAHDTMLLHHALQPEMQKGLGFLASIYTNEAQWKFMGRADVKKEG